MKKIDSVIRKAAKLMLVMTIICGIIYTGMVTIFSNVFFRSKANGSIIEVDGKKYGSELLAQKYTDENHMWGRIMNLDTTTFQDKEGNYLMYSFPSNLSPKSEEFKVLVDERVEMILNANPDSRVDQIPVDLVTCSGSGLDPDISVAAAQYQIPRIAKANNMSEAKVQKIVDACTTHKVLGIFGEETVNVLKVNLMLEGIL